VTACGSEPEKLLEGCWTETAWDYERADANDVPRHWKDGVRVQQYADRQVVRHEAEAWEFKPGELVIHGLDGETHVAHWRLKGRGHVLTLWHDDERFEVYDIKELDRDELILHYDMGMEVRGIARLEFERTSCSTTQAHRGPPDEDLALVAHPKSGNAQ
jgi:hypothetical protein